MQIENINLDGNEDRIIALFNAVYSDTPDRVPDVAELRWRYGGAPYPARLWAAVKDNEIVGLRPLVLRPLKIGPAIWQCLHLMDAIVRPDFQGQGVFRSLMQTVWQNHQQDGAFAFTYPNSNSLKAYRRWQPWSEAVNLRLWARFIPTVDPSDNKWLTRLSGGLAGLAAQYPMQAVMRSAASQSLTITKQEDFDEGVEELWRDNSGKYFFAMPRDLKYLRWRYTDRPSVKYVVYHARSEEDFEGFLVTREREMFDIRLGILADFLVRDDDPHILNALVKQALADFARSGAAAVGSLYEGPSRLIAALVANGFYPMPKFLVNREFALYTRPAGQYNESLNFFKRPGAYVTWGDNDAV